MRRISIFEDEWLMLVDLVDGVIPHGSGQEELDFATNGLLETRLAQRTADGIRVTALGRLVRVAEPPWLPGAGRVWFGSEEIPGECGTSEAKSECAYHAEFGDGGISSGVLP